MGGVLRQLSLLLDTHAFLWWIDDDRRLGAAARRAVLEGAVYVSAASAWEIGTKRALGKLQAPGDVGAWIVDNEFEELPIRVDHAVASAELPRHHGDPFDRILIAQAQIESLRLVTADPRIVQYEVEILPADR